MTEATLLRRLADLGAAVEAKFNKTSAKVGSNIKLGSGAKIVR